MPFKNDHLRSPEYLERRKVRMAESRVAVKAWRAERALKEDRESIYVTIKEFMRLAKIGSRTTLDKLRKNRPAGFPTEYRPAGRPLFKRSEVLAWMEAQPLW